METNLNPANRYAAVDGLRALAALLVMNGHILCLLYRYPYPSWTWFWTNGDIAVMYFLVISGFCLALPVIKHEITIPSLAVYLLRRAARILPPLWGAIAVGLFVFVLRFGVLPNGLPGNLRDFALMIHDVTGSGKDFNAPLWTIGVEWRCYLLLPVIVLAWRRFGYKKTFIAVTLCTLLYWFFFERTKVLYVHCLFLIAFTLGIGAAYIATGRAPSLAGWRKHPWGIIALGANVCLFSYHMLQSSWPHEWLSVYTDLFYRLLISFAAFTTLVVVGSGAGLPARIFGWKPLANIGQWSYSLYLLHVPVFYLGWTLMPQLRAPWHPYLATSAVLVPLTLACCYGFYCIVEKPAMALSAKLQTVRLPRLLPRALHVTEEKVRTADTVLAAESQPR